MPQLLLELFQEEIPARMQAQAAADLLRLLAKSLTDRGLTVENAQTHVTPRRLAFAADLPAASAGIDEELKGPRTSAPPAALDGFLKKIGLTRDDLTIQADPKGDFYLAKISKPGRPAPDIIAEAAVETIKFFPWPKSMRWESSRLQWVRPLRHILCLFDGQVVPFQIAGLTASNFTRGHRQMANEPFEVQDFDDYRDKLRERRVILDREDRKAEIHRQALTAAGKAGLNFREDNELLDEVAGLVEWPIVLTGKFDEAFLDVPNEVLVTTMRKNQKYFALTTGIDATRPIANGAPTRPHPEEGALAPVSKDAQKLAPAFLIVSNLEARDGGAAITAGNEKVIRPRLADAKFFWDLDRKATLESRLDELKKITFHAKLGTQYDRVERITRLAGEIAQRIGCDEQQIADAKLAARLCKADLVTGTVDEFPEVQGTIGGYLARAEGLGETVATAIADHYRPQGPGDGVPTEPVSVAVALADKLDTLVGFFFIEERPTGSKDPFALRRAALATIRLILEQNARLPLSILIHWSITTYVLNGFRPEPRYSRLANEYSPPDEVAPLPSWADRPYERLVNWDHQCDAAGFAQAGLPGFFEHNASKEEQDEANASMRALRVLRERLDALDQLAMGIYFENLETGQTDTLIELSSSSAIQGPAIQVSGELAAFFTDRLKVALRERGIRHDLIDSVFALTQTQPVMAGLDPAIQPEGAPAVDGRLKGGHDDGGDLVLLVRRVEALQSFLSTDDGKTLLAGYKRAANILRIEEKKDKTTYAAAVDRAKLEAPEEQALSHAIDTATPEIERALRSEDFAAAMRALSALRAPVDAFFEKVTVNAPDAALRTNRLNLLARIKQAAHLVADFSKIEG